VFERKENLGKTVVAPDFRRFWQSRDKQRW